MPIGKVLAVGYYSGRWMYVVRVDEHNVYGRVWSTHSGRWSRSILWYPRDTIGKREPNSPMPRPPEAVRPPMG